MSKSDGSIFVGMDVHKAAINVAVVRFGAREPEAEWQLANEPRATKRLIKRLKAMTAGEVRAAYEAGPCGYALQRTMLAAGIDCIVVAPSLIPVKPGARGRQAGPDAGPAPAVHRADRGAAEVPRQAG